VTLIVFYYLALSILNQGLLFHFNHWDNIWVLETTLFRFFDEVSFSKNFGCEFLTSGIFCLKDSTEATIADLSDALPAINVGDLTSTHFYF
jgi:hypothetical protein